MSTSVLVYVQCPDNPNIVRAAIFIEEGDSLVRNQPLWARWTLLCYEYPIPDKVDSSRRQQQMLQMSSRAS